MCGLSSIPADWLIQMRQTVVNDEVPPDKIAPDLPSRTVLSKPNANMTPKELEHTIRSLLKQPTANTELRERLEKLAAAEISFSEFT